MSKTDELRDMSDEHLRLTLKEAVENLFRLRIQQQTEKLDAPSELRRNRRRTALTFLGLVISFFLYTALESVLYTMSSVISRTASDTVLFLKPRDRLAFWRPSLPTSYTAQVAAMPGVVAAAPIRFESRGSRIHQTRGLPKAVRRRAIW